LEQIRKCSGTFTILWHNESLSDKGNWKGWRDVFESLVKTATNHHD